MTFTIDNKDARILYYTLKESIDEMLTLIYMRASEPTPQAMRDIVEMSENKLSLERVFEEVKRVMDIAEEDM